MKFNRKKEARNSKKRRNLDVRKNISSKPRTLIVTHADGSTTTVNPNPQYFDGDFKTLAISLARPKERVTWKVV